MWHVKTNLIVLSRTLCKNLVLALIVICLIHSVTCARKYSLQDVLSLREEVREMFQHAYDGYLRHAAEYDELRPLSCDGVDTWGSYSLTLIDSLDTLAVMGNYTEFRRVVNVLIDKSNFDSDINVSVFETNIRIVGGLISAHLLSHRAGIELEPGWPCNGPILRMAEDVARRLLPAFDTITGMPYGTVNLKYGVPVNETTITCTAGVGTFIVEFGALSRLTGDPIYEEVALNAIHSLHKHKSTIGLYGNHIDVQTGRWTGVDAGIGAGVDSYYEYLVKGSIMLNRPELLEIFHESKAAIDKYIVKNDWHVWVSMTKGQVTLPVFQSLDAYWPGVLSMLGDIPNAMKSIFNYHSVWKQYGFLPEFYNIPNSEAGTNRESYPLRPELIESVMYLYRVTGDSYLLEVGEDMLRSIQSSAKTSCGYATIKNVRDHRKDNRMESFFLSETTKYLYLLFDANNFLNNNGATATIVNTPNGECLIDSGGYIFNTEAHPVDPSALRCCHDVPRQQLLADFDHGKFVGEAVQFSTQPNDIPTEETVDEESMDSEIIRISNLTTFNIDKLLKSEQDKNDLIKLLHELKERNARDMKVDINLEQGSPVEIDDLILSEERQSTDAAKSTEHQFTEDAEQINIVKTKIFEKLDDNSAAVKNLSKGKDAETMQTSNNDVFSENAASENEDMVFNASNDGGNSANVNPFKGNKIVPPPAITSLPAFPPYEKQTPFDAQLFMERVRTMYNDKNVTRNYEVLTCKTQPYTQRLAVMGEIMFN